MRDVVVLALRVVLVLVFLGSLFVQIGMAPLLWADLEGWRPDVRAEVVAIFVLFFATLQVSAIGVWLLLTIVRRRSALTSGALRAVDVIIGALAAGAVLVFLLAVVLAPGEAAAPGVVLLVGLMALALGGAALVVLLLRLLLARAAGPGTVRS